jgi:hypothetical protein
MVRIVIAQLFASAYELDSGEEEQPRIDFTGNDHRLARNTSATCP